MWLRGCLFLRTRVFAWRMKFPLQELGIFEIRKKYIGPLESLAHTMSVELLGPVMVNAEVFAFLDNDGSLGQFVRGYTRRVDVGFLADQAWQGWLYARAQV